MSSASDESEGDNNPAAVKKPRLKKGNKAKVGESTSILLKESVVKTSLISIKEITFVLPNVSYSACTYNVRHYCGEFGLHELKTNNTEKVNYNLWR